MRTLGLCVLVALSFTQAAALEGQVSESQRLTQVQRQLESNKRKLAPKKAQKKKAELALGKIKRDIHFNELKLKKSRQQLQAALLKERSLKKELRALSQDAGSLSGQLKQRIRAVYKHKPLSMLEAILSQNNWVLDTDSDYFFSALMKHDVSLLEKTQKSLRQLKEKNKKLEQNTASIRQLRAVIKDKEKQLKRHRARKSRHIASLDTEIKKILNQNKELERLSRELTNLIARESGSKKYYGTGRFVKPAKGWVSSRYGMRMHPIFKRRIKHAGVDIAAPKGRPIVAADAGKVIFAGTKGGYGKSVLIYHGKNPKTGKTLSTFYAHQSRLLVKKGDVVKRGEEIGWVGSTGFATGPHLHFEVKENGKAVNPERFMRL